MAVCVCVGLAWPELLRCLIVEIWHRDRDHLGNGHEDLNNWGTIYFGKRNTERFWKDPGGNHW